MSLTKGKVKDNANLKLRCANGPWCHLDAICVVWSLWIIHACMYDRQMLSKHHIYYGY